MLGDERRHLTQVLRGRFRGVSEIAVGMTTEADRDCLQEPEQLFTQQPSRATVGIEESPQTFRTNADHVDVPHDGGLVPFLGIPALGQSSQLRPGNAAEVAAVEAIPDELSLECAENSSPSVEELEAVPLGRIVAG